MQFLIIQRILGLLLMLFSTTLLPPLIISIFAADGLMLPFLYASVASLATGLLLWLTTRRCKRDLRLRDGFIAVVLFWLVLGLFGALPFYLEPHIGMTVTDAVFESISGLTTTGATVITNLDQLAPSILFYRQQLQWLGGMGIIVLAVAILPLLGIGGMQLYRAEAPGPMNDKLTPRITETAKALWYIYLGLTIACALSYWIAGMSLFDAVSHSFSTIAIGGFSTHDESMGFFADKPMVEVVAIIFMYVSGINFALHFLSWRGRDFSAYLRDEELLTYTKVLLGVALITSIYLYHGGTFDTLGEAVLHGLFQTVSIGTTAGFTTSDYVLWPPFLTLLLLFVSFIGGSAGSTGGGMKVIRFLLLLKQGKRELTRIVHPHAIIPIKIGGKPMPERVIDSVWGFFAAYVALFSILLLLLMMSGLDQITAFSAVAACMNNLGPGLGEVGLNYVTLSDFAKWLLCFAMLLGRLEIFTLLVLVTPAFWRK